jgi:hypothetical protein
MEGTMLDKILFGLCLANLGLNIISKNWMAVGGWLVACLAMLKVLIATGG